MEIIYSIVLSNAITFVLMASYFNHKINKLSQKVEGIEESVKNLDNDILCKTYKTINNGLSFNLKRGNLSDLK